MNELDNILLDQLHSARRRMKRITKVLKFTKDPGFELCLQQCEKNIALFENMIEDKTLLQIKSKKFSIASPLSNKRVMKDYYRFVMFVTFYGYYVMCDSVKNYFAMFKGKSDG